MNLKQWLGKYWFLLGLILMALITVADTREWTVAVGRSLKNHGGPNLVIFSIFLFSGLTLDAGLLRKGLGDLRATLSALLVVFIFSPLVALAFEFLPLDIQILTGLCLVAVMPSTLSTGVVMTKASGGNMAHALFVTVLANTIAVFTIPVVLSLLLAVLGDPRSVVIDKAAIMLKIAWLVLAPLAMGTGLQYAAARWVVPLQRKVQLINQLLVLTIVWMGMCQSRATLIDGGAAILPVAAVSIGFHLLLVLISLGLCRALAIGPGRRESVIFMGSQKTLPLSVILQVTLFADYGLTLAVCVVHHILHLMMDAYLVERLKSGWKRR
jgi:sodium/bile acid cotransporter 7